MRGTLRECWFGVVQVAVQACRLPSETGGIRVPQLLLLLLLSSSNKKQMSQQQKQIHDAILSTSHLFLLLVVHLLLLVLCLLLLVLYLLLLVSYLLLLLVEFAVVVGNFGPP